MKSITGVERRESPEEKAERMVKEELEKAGWAEEELSRRAKGDSVKLRMAARVDASQQAALRSKAGPAEEGEES